MDVIGNATNGCRRTSRLVAEVKGFSSHAVRQMDRDTHFRWQDGYAAFSVSSDDVPAVERYVRHQKKHHAVGAVEASLEEA